MSPWSFDMTAAPRDSTHVILALPNKTTLRSYWCTPKGEPEHWCMLSHKNEPVAWMLWPEHPFAAASQGEAAAKTGAISGPTDGGENVESSVSHAARAGQTSNRYDALAGQVEPRNSLEIVDPNASGPDVKRAPVQPETSHETMGGTGDDCSFGNRGVWPPQGGASSSRGNDSLSVVTAGETAPQFIIEDVGSI